MKPGMFALVIGGALLFLAYENPILVLLAALLIGIGCDSLSKRH